MPRPAPQAVPQGNLRAARPLLPRPEGQPPPNVPQKHKQKRPHGVCTPCRARKTKCDAARPVCEECGKRGTQCSYELTPAKRKRDDLETRLQKAESSQNTLHQLIHALQTRPAADAQAILRRLREGQDVESILRHVTAGDLLLQLHVEPETKFRFVFPFRHQMPSFLQTTDNRYLGSVIYHTAYAATEDQADSGLPPVNQHTKPEYLKPYSSATIVDPRLEAVKPSNWTQVLTDDNLMRLLLKLYFQYEYPSWPLFQKDLFLEDMLSGSKSNCSSLLVNVVLAYACHCHLALSDRLEYWNPHSLGYKFLAEGKRLWEQESRDKNHVTRVQAGVLIYTLLGMYSMDKLGMTYLVQAVIMANDMNLFGAPRQTWSARKKHAYAFTAWCVYYYCSITCYHYMAPRLVKETPKTPLPSYNESPAWYGEFFLQYPLSPSLTAMDFGRNFKASAELSVIVNDLHHHLYDGEEGEDITQKLVENAKRLLDWYSALPAELAPEKIVLHFQLKLHALYHNIMINLCERMMSTETPYKLSPPLNNIPAMLQKSKISVETIMRLYYLRHGFDKSDIYSTYFLNHLAFITIERLSALRCSNNPASSLEALQEAQSTLILAAKGLYDQGKNWYLSYTIFHMTCKSIGPSELDILHRYTGIRKDDLSTSKLRVKHVQTQFPIKIFSGGNDPENLRLEELVQRYADMALESSDASEVGSPN